MLYLCCVVIIIFFVLHVWSYLESDNAFALPLLYCLFTPVASDSRIVETATTSICKLFRRCKTDIDHYI